MEDIKIERLKEVVKEKGWTQKKIAEESGYTQQYISNLLKGIRPIGEDCANAIGKVLGINPEYILGKSDFKSVEDYWKKSCKYHANFEGKLLELLEMLEIHVSMEPYILEKRTIKRNTDLSEIENTVDERSQAFKISMPGSEKIISEMEFLSIKNDIVKSIIDRIEK